MKGFWAQLEAELNLGSPVYLVLVVAHRRGSPGTVGARMFVCADGRQVGTIGGSVLELDLVGRARELLAAAPSGADLPKLERFVHRRSDPLHIAPGESGLICSGWQQHVSVALRPERDLETIHAIAECDAQGGYGAVWITQAGIQFDDAAPDLMSPAIDLQTERGWRVEEQLLNRQRLVIFGGGHCGLALSRVMAELDWYITVVDRRADVATFRDNDCADQHVLVEDFASGAESLSWPQLTDAIVMTTDYHSDVRALLGCLGQPLRSIGVMGSPAKLRVIREALTDAGVGAADLARVRGPVGLRMKSDTPAEIAVSVAAELLQFADR
ncbi:MAG: XdhC family protein [Gammaproteobacteria bacterium]|nr:XdhC family protein [Gammaproteobacteria bacterium]